MIYQKTYTIYSAMCDCSDHLSVWGLARLLQQVAEEHTEITNIGFGALLQHNKAWILSRMLYKINKLPGVGTKVTAKTWSRGCNDLFAYREFILEDESNNILVSASSYWVLIDIVQRKIARIQGVMDNYEHHPESATGIMELRKIHAQPGCLDTVLYQYDVDASFSSLDHVRHVNNSEYLKWLSDAIIAYRFSSVCNDSDHIPVNNQSDNFLVAFNTPLEIEIDYLNEIHLGDRVSIQIHPQNIFSIRTSNNLSSIIVIK